MDGGMMSFECRGLVMTSVQWMRCKDDQVYEICQFVFTDKAMMDATSQIDTCRLAMDCSVSKLKYIYIYIHSYMHEHLDQPCNYAMTEEYCNLIVKSSIKD